MIKAILLKPLDGMPEGATREFDKEDFDRLKALGAVRAASASAEKSEKAATAEKAAPAPLNKNAPPVANKASMDVRAPAKPLRKG